MPRIVESAKRNASLTGIVKRALFVVVVSSAFAASLLASADDAGVPVPDGGSRTAASDAGVDAGISSGPDDGAYRLQDASEVDADVNARVDDAIHGLHPSMRDTFRAQLRASLAVPRTLRVARTADALTLTYDSTSLAAPLSGDAVSQRGLEGRPVQVVHHLESGAYVQEIRTGQFRRTDRLVVDGAGLRLEIELRTGLLPRPLHVVATFARATAQADAGTP